MSDLLSIVPGVEIPLGTSLVDAHIIIRNRFAAQNWQVVSEDTTSTPTTKTHLYLVPPSTESIGNTYGREVVYMTFEPLAISIYPISQALVDMPQVIWVRPLTAGAVTASITIGSSTVSYTGSSSNTAIQNLRGLYEALAASVDTTISAWNWVYHFPPAQNGNDTNPYLYGIQKVAATNATPTYVNVTGATIGSYHAAGLQSVTEAEFIPAQTLTIDLTSGFAYFLQLNSRSFHLATRTVTGYYGPVHAEWGDHDAALTVMPNPNLYFERFLTPMELMVGTDAAATYAYSTGVTGKVWSLGVASFGNSASYYIAHPFGRHGVRGVIMDSNQASNTAHYSTIDLPGSSVFSGSDTLVANDYQIHKQRMVGHEATTGTGGGIGTNYIRRILGQIILNDWYKFCGSGSDESLFFVADSVDATTLGQAMDASTDYPAITLASTAGLAASGLVVIEGEAISYTSISGLTITGCTRGVYGTTRMAHVNGVAVYQGLWFIKINGGALYAGTTKPVAA